MKHGWIKTLALILALMLSAGQAMADGSLLDGFLTSTQVDDAGNYIGICTRYELEEHNSGDIIFADACNHYPADPVISEGFFWASGASDSLPDRALSYALVDLDGNIAFEIRKEDTLGTPSRVVDGRFYIRSGSDDAPYDTSPDAVSSNIIFDTQGNELRRLTDDVNTSYYILGYADGHFLVSMWKTRSNNEEDPSYAERYILVLDRDGNVLYDPIFIVSKGQDHLYDYHNSNVTYLGEHIFYIYGFGTINAANGTTQTWSLDVSQVYDADNRFLGGFYDGKLLIMSCEKPLFYVVILSDLQENRTNYYPSERIDRPDEITGDSEGLIDGVNNNPVVRYSGGVLVDALGHVFDLEGNQYDWYRRYIRGSYFRLKGTLFHGGYAVVTCADQDFQQLVTVIDTNGVEQYEPILIPYKDRLVDAHDGYALFEHIGEWDNALNTDMEYYLIYPDGSRHSASEETLSELGDLTFYNICRGRYYDWNAIPQIIACGHGGVVRDIHETDDTRTFDPHAPADLTYNGDLRNHPTIQGRTKTFEGSDLPGMTDETGMLAALTSNVLVDEDDLRIYLSEVNEERMSFRIEKSGPESEKTYRLSLSAINGIGMSTHSDYTEEMDGWFYIWSGHNDFASSYNWLMLQRTDGAAQIPLESLTFSLWDEYPGNNNKIEHPTRTFTLYTSDYDPADIGKLRGELLEEWVIMEPQYDGDTAMVPVGLYEIPVRSGFCVCLAYEGEQTLDRRLKGYFLVNGRWVIYKQLGCAVDDDLA